MGYDVLDIFGKSLGQGELYCVFHVDFCCRVRRYFFYVHIFLVQAPACFHEVE